jgi:hypothetical protein
MPFTLSHAAAVLPFSRPLARWRLLSAAVIGSMVPDFGFLMPWHVERVESHTAMGLLTFCLPIGLASYWVFQYLIKMPVIELLPDGAYQRWLPLESHADLASFRQWIFAAGGVLFGAATHLVWDGFTHEGARGVRMLPALDDPVFDIGGHRLLGVRLMQDGGSLVGLIVVIAIAWYGLRKGSHAAEVDRPLRSPERQAWVLAYAVSTIVLSIGWFYLMRRFSYVGHTLGATIGAAAVASLRGLTSAMLLVSVLLTRRLRADPVLSARTL